MDYKKLTKIVDGVNIPKSGDDITEAPKFKGIVIGEPVYLITVTSDQDWTDEPGMVICSESHLQDAGMYVTEEIENLRPGETIEYNGEDSDIYPGVYVTML